MDTADKVLVTSCDMDFLASFHSQLQLTRVTRKRGPQKMR